jgi:glycosyl transferase family 25
MMNVPVYVIHAKSLPERMPHLKNELIRAGLTAHWITDFDANELTTEIEDQWFTRTAPLSKGQKSCALKHITALQLIRDNRCEHAIILEDDAILVENFVKKFQEVLKEAQEWPRPYAISLGVGTNWYTHPSDLKHGKILYKGAKNRNAEAYVIGAPEAALRLNWIAQHKLSQPIDIAYNFADNETGIEIIWATPPLAEQGSLNGKFKSSLDPKGRSHRILRSQFSIQKFRRKHVKRWVNLTATRLANYWPWRIANRD